MSTEPMTLFFRSMRFPIIICAFSPFFCVFSRSDVVVHKSVTVFFTCTSACQGLAQYPDATEELKGSTTGTCCCARSFSANSASMRFTSSCIFMLLIFSCAKSFDSLLFSATNLSHLTRSSSTCIHSQHGRSSQLYGTKADSHAAGTPLAVLFFLLCTPLMSRIVFIGFRMGFAWRNCDVCPLALLAMILYILPCSFSSV